MTSLNHKRKKEARDKEQSKQARRIINGIFTGFIILMVLCLLAYYALFK